MTKETLWALRKQIVLNSLFIADYQNTFGIDSHAVCDFFDGYLDYLEEAMEKEVAGFKDEDFFVWLPRYDTPDNLWNWYGCFVDDPLPLPQEGDIAA